MSFTNVYIGDEQDLSLYKGDDIIGFTFTVTNADDSAYDFTGLTDLNLIIYNHRGGDVLATITNGATGVSQSTNVITWNSDYSADIAISDLGLHYYELTWNDSNAKPITVSYGKLKII